MKLGQIFNSLTAWQKLSAINLRAKLAYRLLKYTALVSAEHAIVRKQQIAIVHEVMGTKEGDEVRMGPDMPEFPAYAEKFNPVLQTESDLPQFDMDFEEVVNAVDEKEESLSVSDLAMLEPFFSSENEVIPAGLPETK